MIIAIEPCYEYLPGKMLVIEENILVTKKKKSLLVKVYQKMRFILTKSKVEY